MNSRPGLSITTTATQVHTEPQEFVRAVIERARGARLELVTEPLDVWPRYFYEWRRPDGSVFGERVEVLSCGLDEVKLRACLSLCRELCWPIGYEMGRNIHLDFERVPKREDAEPATVLASTLRGTGAYVPPFVPDHELVEVAR